MSTGHGAPGLRSALRTFLDLIDDTGVSRVPMLEVLAGKEMASGSWTVHSGSIYKQAAAFTYDGVLRDVVAVECSIAPKILTRVEAIADIVAGTYYFDPDAAAPELYLRLPDSSNPSAAVVRADLLFCFATKSVVHPWLGPNRLTDGGLETWTTSTDLTSWLEEESGTGWVLAQDAAIAPSGSFGVLLRAAGATSGYRQIRQGVPGSFVVGKWYRASGVYSTTPAFTGLEGRLYIGNGASNYLAQDGRNVNVSDVPILQPTQGEVRRFAFDFLAHDTAFDFIPSLRHVSGTADGTLRFDDLRVQRIYRFNLYDPRLAADSIPQVEFATAKRFFGGKVVGVGEARIINQDGTYEAVFGDLELHGRSATVIVGGEFQDGQTIGREDCRVSYPGTIQDVDGDDRYHSLRLEALTYLRTVLPLNLYRLADNPLMELNREGFGRPLLLGRGNFGGPVTRYIKPTRIAIDATTGYGEYETLDPSNAPQSINASTIHTFKTSEEREAVI